MAAAGTFAAFSFLFGSPLIAAVILIEAAGLGGARLPLVLVPGLMAAGIGSLVSTGLGSWTGVDTAAISIDPLPLEAFARPDIADFLWTIPLAAAIAFGAVLIFAAARRAEPVVARRRFLLTPAIGLAVAGLAVAFNEITDQGVQQVLYSGQDQIGSLISGADAWSVGALAAVIAFKGIAYSISLAGFRGGPVFPALFLGAAAGLMAAGLPDFGTTPAVAVSIAAATAAVLRLPLSGIVLAVVLCSKAGLGVDGLIVVGAVVAYLVAQALDPREPPSAPEPRTAPQPA
jgi:H+/Cl- antiporter ClcA